MNELSSRARISIDQNFLWEFSVAKRPAAVRLHEALEKAFLSQKIVCPLHSEETGFESSLLPAELRKSILEIARHLSGGLAFHDFGNKVGLDTLSIARPSFSYPTLRLGAVQTAVDPDQDAVGQNNRAAKEDFGERLTAAPYPPASYSQDMGLKEIQEEITTERVASMYRLVKAIRDAQNLQTGKDEWDHTIAIAEILLGWNITNEECERLLHAILHREWETTPTLFVHSRLWAQVEHDHLKSQRKRGPNDFLDITRLSVALNDAVVVLCDRAMADLIRTSGVSNLFPRCRVFSLRNADDATALIASL